MSFSFARGETIALAAQVVAGDPTAVTAATASLRPALASNPALVDPAQAKVADFTVALQSAATDGSYPAFWLLTISATAAANIALGNYLTQLRCTFADSTISDDGLIQVAIYEPATVA